MPCGFHALFAHLMPLFSFLSHGNMTNDQALLVGSVYDRGESDSVFHL